MRTSASTAALLLAMSSHLVSAQTTFYPGVIATGTQGVTNPPQATMGTAINQTSMARLLSVNSVDVSITILLSRRSVDEVYSIRISVSLPLRRCRTSPIQR